MGSLFSCVRAALQYSSDLPPPCTMRLLSVILGVVINRSYSYWVSDFMGFLIDLQNEDQHPEINQILVSNAEDNDLLANLKNKISLFVPVKLDVDFIEFLNS